MGMNDKTLHCHCHRADCNYIGYVKYIGVLQRLTVVVDSLLSWSGISAIYYVKERSQVK